MHIDFSLSHYSFSLLILSKRDVIYSHYFMQVMNSKTPLQQRIAAKDEVWKEANELITGKVDSNDGYQTTPTIRDITTYYSEKSIPTAPAL